MLGIAPVFHRAVEGSADAAIDTCREHQVVGNRHINRRDEVEEGPADPIPRGTDASP